MIAETMQRLWAEIATAERPDTIIAGPVFVAVADVIATLPPRTNWRRRKKLVNKAVKKARRSGFPPINRAPLEWWTNRVKD